MEAAENATAAVVVKEEENADVEAAARSHEEAGEAAEPLLLHGAQRSWRNDSQTAHKPPSSRILCGQTHPLSKSF